MSKADAEIASRASPRPIADVASELGLGADDIEMYGHYKAKVAPHVWERLQDRPDGLLVLVTAVNPTPAGEGKTTVTVGLGQALNRLGKRAVIALREPSLGPVFGVKGGAAGGGFSQVLPMEDINLHFTGDLHAITAANNLLAALLDNHLQQGNALDIDPRTITWRRAMDMNDRALREIVVGLGGKSQGVPRQDGFNITAASEVMAILCLSASLDDLRERLGRIVVGYSREGTPVTAHDLKAQGAMAMLLKEAIKPNLVQTLEGTPAFVHGGPFANIAHGCNSLIATRHGLKLGEYLVTEAGFGADLGAEKFLDIKCRVGGLQPACVVIVATIRALKHQGGVALAELGNTDASAVRRGFVNLQRHYENMTSGFGLPAVVAVNRFGSDADEEIAALQDCCASIGAPVAVADVWGAGGEGGRELAELVVQSCRRPALAGKGGDGGLQFAYDLDMPLRDKIDTLARRVYRAAGVDFSKDAERTLRQLERDGLGRLPVCIAKTQYSFSDNPDLLGAPSGFTITVREVRPSVGAGFVVCLTGEIMTMPGLPKVAAAEGMDVDASGHAVGLF